MVGARALVLLAAGVWGGYEAPEWDWEDSRTVTGNEAGLLLGGARERISPAFFF